MSLIAHYKLDGNANDVLGKYNGTASNVTWVDGKLGKAGSFNGSNINLSNNPISETGEFSLAFWVNPRSTKTGCFFCARTVIGKGLSVFYLNGTIRFDFGNQWTTSVSLDNDQWNHIVLTRSGNTKIIYKNGVFKGSTTFVDLTDFNPILATIGCSQINGNNYDNYFDGLIDDVRIYDHALSEREVRDLSQGLVLHYTFDQFQEPTENILALAGYDCTVERSGTSYPFTSQDITALVQSKWSATNNKISIQMESKNDVGVGYARMYVFFSDWSWNTSFGVNDTSWALRKLQNISMPDPTGKTVIFAIYHYTSDSTGKSYARNIQIEFKASCTSFVNGTRAGIVRDQSTQGNDAPLALANTPKWVEGGMVGKGCYELNQTKYITLPKSTLGSLPNCTFSFWRKRTSAGSWIVGNSGTPAGSSYFMATSGGTGAFYHSGVGTPVIYRDGVLSTTPANDDLWHHYCLVGANLSTWVNLHINAYDMETTWLFRGQIDDVRIYATALTTEEIRELYRQRASLDSVGNLLC